MSSEKAPSAGGPAPGPGSARSSGLADSDALLVFDLGTQRYALAASATREVVPIEKMLSVPRTASTVLGLFPLRGSALALIDTSGLLGLEAAGGRRLAVVIVKGETVVCAITVDNVVGVLRVDASTFTPGDQQTESGVLGFASTPQAGTFTVLDTAMVLQKIDQLRF